MQSAKVRAFKNELRNYKYYQFKISNLQNSIEYAYERLGGVRAIDPSKEPIHSQPNKEYEWRVREDIEEYEAKIGLYKAKVNEIDKILSLLPNKEKDIIIDVYFNNMTYDQVARKYYMSKSTISGRIDKQLEKVLD